MFLDLFQQEKRSYSDTEKVLLKAFGLDVNLGKNEMKEATYFTCIKLLSEGVAKVPCYLTQATNKGDHRAVDHPIYEKLALRPNPYMNAIDFFKAIEINRQHTGSGAAFIEREPSGRVKDLWPVEVNRIIIDDAGLIRSSLKNKVFVEFKSTGSSKLEVCSYDDILHFKSFTMDGMNSKPNREMVKDVVSTNMKAQDYLGSLYDAGLTNKVVIQLATDIKDKKELRKIQDRFESLYSNRGGRIFTVPAGYSASTMHLSLADVQFEQIKRMSISQIASSFGIKMYQLNDLKDTNNNSLEQQQLSFLIDTLLILFEGNEQELNWKLLTPAERKNGYKFKFNTNVILRTNAEAQANILSKYVSSAIYTPNEARLMLQQQTKEGGDDLIVNAGVLKLKDIMKGGEKMSENKNREHRKSDVKEIRQFKVNGLEVRAANGDESSKMTIGGFAVKYNHTTTIRSIWGDFLEEIAPGAFNESLARSKERGSEKKALWNHDTSKPLGNTIAETLRFKDSTDGLAYDVDLPDNSWGKDLYESVKRKDVDGSSFGFRCLSDSWSIVDDGSGKNIEKRTILKADLFEVSPCTFPAYDSSEISCRSIDEHFEKKENRNDAELEIERLRTEILLKA